MSFSVSVEQLHNFLIPHLVIWCQKPYENLHVTVKHTVPWFSFNKLHIKCSLFPFCSRQNSLMWGTDKMSQIYKSAAACTQFPTAILLLSEMLKHLHLCKMYPNLPKYSVYHVSGAHSEQQSIYWWVESSPEMSKHGFEEVHVPWFPPYWATHKSIHKYLCFEHISFKNYG